ncbi:MAG: cytochrome c peroxidase [Sulfurospirillum sp.]
MKFILILSLIISLTVANSDTELLKKAKKANLYPIPRSKKQLLRLIDDSKNPMTDSKIKLGKKLYFDPRLSKSNLISCNTCHNLALGGVDGLSTATGDRWKANPHHLNSPTVYNAVFANYQFWDGRSFSLKEQAKGPIQTVFEMAMHRDILPKKIQNIKGYKEEFKKAYGKNTKITFELIADTIAIFEKTLITPSRYDDFLNGDMSALSQKEKEGLNTFIDLGCTRCHKGIVLGGFTQPFDTGKRYKYRDIGDFRGNKNHLVKTPTLRNIKETAPYFHNGMVWSLKEAIKEMGKIQLLLGISDKDAQKIETFLNSLTGRKPNIIYPILP